jgi:beta-lysine 5,6-aminomutase alpha subunit
MHTPLLQDRWMSLKNANYVFGAASGLGDEIEFKTDGKINNWADKVLNDTVALLDRIQTEGFFKAIENRAFADVSRSFEGGKGLKGVFRKSPQYLNPFFDLL